MCTLSRQREEARLSDLFKRPKNGRRACVRISRGRRHLTRLSLGRVLCTMLIIFLPRLHLGQANVASEREFRRWRNLNGVSQPAFKDPLFSVFPLAHQPCTRVLQRIGSTASLGMWALVNYVRHSLTFAVVK